MPKGAQSFTLPVKALRGIDMSLLLSLAYTASNLVMECVATMGRAATRSF